MEDLQILLQDPPQVAMCSGCMEICLSDETPARCFECRKDHIEPLSPQKCTNCNADVPWTVPGELKRHEAWCLTCSKRTVIRAKKKEAKRKGTQKRKAREALAKLRINSLKTVPSALLGLLPNKRQRTKTRTRPANLFATLKITTLKMSAKTPAYTFQGKQYVAID